MDNRPESFYKKNEGFLPPVSLTLRENPVSIYQRCVMNLVLQKVLDECFWGDYVIDPIEAEKRLTAGDVEFIKFIINRIISHSTFASARLKLLFTKEQLEAFLPEYSSSARIQYKIKLVRSVLLKNIPGGVRPWI